MRIATAALLVILGLGTARADDDAKKRIAAAKAMLQKQVEAWSQGAGNDWNHTSDANNAFAATLAKDAVVSSRAGDQPETTLGLFPPYNVEHLKITASRIGWSGSWGWIVAELHMTTRNYAEPRGAGDPNPQDEAVVYHWVELVVPDGEGVKGKAIAVGEARPDKRLHSYEEDMKQPVLKKPPALLALAADAANLPAHLASDADTSVLGTGDTEIAFGLAAAKKMVTGWKGLTLEALDVMDKHDHDTPVELVVGDAVVTWGHVRMKLPNHKEGYKLDAFAIARKTASGLEIVALSYLPVH